MVKLDALTKLVGKSPKDINLFFEKWNEHTENERLNVIRTLREEGQLSVKYKTENDNDFRCPLYNFMLTKPCNLNSCPYHLVTKYSDPIQIEAVTQCKNCLINCIDMAKNNRMSANEASTLLGMSISEVNSANASAIAKIRKTKIKEHLEKYQIPRYKYLPGHCISCEQYIQDEIDMNLWPELIIEPGKYGWCCSACREAKPKWQFLVEKEFECQFFQAVATGVIIYKNLEMLGNIFNLNKEILQKCKPEVLETLDELRKFFIEDK
jgi:hypothetical protein